MRKTFLNWLPALLVALMGVCFTACSDDDESPKPTLEVDSDALTFSAEGESKTFRISSNTGWTITGNASWLSVSSISGSKDKSVVVSASENTTVSKRSSQLVVTTDDGSLSKIISVTQTAKSEELSIDMAEINLAGVANSNGAIRITSNTSWSISGASNWLTLSSTNGNGTATITITANTANNAANPRECTLSIVAGSVSKQVKVIQNGLFSSNCIVAPKTIVCLADGFAFDYTYGKDVAYYYTKLYNPRALERMTDAEIVANMSEDINDRDTPNDGYVTSWRNLSPMTEYVVCTVGFDENGTRGELKRTTLKTKSDTNQALVSISDVEYSDTYWYWATSINGFVTRYYQWFVTNDNLHISTDAAIAWFFQQEMKRYPEAFPAIAQGDIWIRERNGSNIFDVVTWAVDVTGEFSGIIDRFAGEISSSSSNKVEKVNIKKNQNPFKPYLIYR